MTWLDEISQILSASEHYGVDARFVMAIRRTENGRIGSFGVDSRAYGVLSVHAPTYADQLDVCCKSVRNRLHEYRAGNPLMRVARKDGSRRLAYCDRFLETFADRWAPVGAENDPKSLNSNWLHNCRKFYTQFIEAGLSAEQPQPRAAEEV